MGGLFSFVVLLQAVRSGPDHERLPTVLAALVPRFTVLAIAAVAVLTLTGPFHSWLQVKTPSALGTVHGLSLVVKVLLIVPMLVLGGINMRILNPQLARLLGERGPGLRAPTEATTGRLSRAVMIEAGLAIFVLVAAAILTAVQPAREEYARKVQPIELTAQANDMTVKLGITPARPGPNEFIAEVTGAVAPPNDVQRVQLRFTNLDDELGSSLLTLTPRDDGRFSAVSTNVTVDGTWQIEMFVRRRGLGDVRTAFRAPIVTPDAAGQPPSLDAVPNPTTIPARQLISVAPMATGLALTFWISRTRDVRRRERTTLYAASFAVAMIGGVLYARSAITPPLPQDARALKNPFAPDTASIARGQEIYQQQCATCHGLSGRGDGPLAATLRPRPADFRVHMAAGHTDGELFTWLSKGAGHIHAGLRVTAVRDRPLAPRELHPWIRTLNGIGRGSWVMGRSTSWADALPTMTRFSSDVRWLWVSVTRYVSFIREHGRSKPPSRRPLRGLHRPAGQDPTAAEPGTRPHAAGAP